MHRALHRPVVSWWTGRSPEEGAWTSRRGCESLGLGRYEQAFRENDIDAEVLPELTAEDLGARRRLDRPPAQAARGDRRPAGRGEPCRRAAQAVAAHCGRRAGAERRQLTVMFADLVGSTALSARLDPEDMREVLGAYQNAARARWRGSEGIVAKFMGDGVLAYFGWPRAHEDDAERAVRAGLGVVTAVPGSRRRAADRSRPGRDRDRPRGGRRPRRQGAAQEEAVVGETPNLAARLQEAGGARRAW